MWKHEWITPKDFIRCVTLRKDECENANVTFGGSGRARE
eukprot:COSAG03_NODE_29242_length_187_cov_1800.897727_2_plen_38_part_01